MSSTRTRTPPPTLALALEHPAATYALATSAHHEAAHAVLALRLGGTVGRVRLWQVGPACWHGDVTVRVQENPDGNRTAAVVALAGVPAELRWADLHRVRETDLPHDVYRASEHDRSVARDSLARIPRAERPRFHEVERQAAVLVDRCWDRIEHLATRLATPYQPHS